MELALFRVLSDVEKLVFLKRCQSILTVKSSFTLDVEKEEIKWLKYWKNSLSSLLLKMENKSVSCKELHSLLILLTCPSLPDKPVFIPVSHLQNILEIWEETYL